MKPAPFDRVAADYDHQFTHTPVGQLQRQRVYRLLDELLNAASIQQVLEFSCGTGEDARWLAQRGCQVLATDSSAGMIEVARQKNADWAGEKIPPQFRVLPFQQITELPAEESYDLVLSNFGGLNCLSPTALSEWAEALAPRMRSGAYLAAVVMGRFCLWESLYFLSKGAWSKAWRRRTKGPVVADLGDGATIDTWYYSPREFSAVFEENFSLHAIRPIGLALPPSYLDPFFSRRPNLLARMKAWEKRWGDGAWGASLADHYWLLLQKK